MKRFLSVILILLFTLQMPCLAEADGIEAGASIVVEDIAVAKDGMDPTNVDAAPVVEKEATTTEEAASAAENEVASEAESTDTKTASADEGTLSIDTEVIAAPIEADVPEAEADLDNNIPGMAFEATGTAVASGMLFDALTTYTITSNCIPDGCGSVHAMVNNSYYALPVAGNVITLVASPEENYELKSINVTWNNNNSIESLTVTDNKFIMPAGDVTVTATFAMKWAYVKEQLQNYNDVTLTTNVTRPRGSEDETIEVVGYANCTLDLNGHTLDNGENSYPAIRVVGKNAKLTITDSSEEKTGVIINGNGDTAIEVKNGASLTLAGGSIANANPNNRLGNGVKCEDSNSRFTMESGSITGFDTAVNLGYGTCFTLSGGKISASKTGVSNYRCAFIMSGGTITGCINGVSLASTSTMTMTGGIITQNEAWGVGIADDDATLSVSDNSVITRNEDWWTCGVNLITGRPIAVTGALGADAQIGVYMDIPGVCVVGTGGYTLTEDDLIHFSSDSPDYTIIMNAEGKGELTKKPVPDASPDPVPVAPTTPSTPEAPTQLSVTKKNSTSTAFLGMTYQIVPGTGTGTRFKSSNKKVATVDQNGLITPHKPGKAKITFKVGKKKRTVTLKVKDPTVPTSVVFTPVEKTVKKGDTITLTPVIPDGTNAGGFKWKSSNKKVARVDQNGKVTFRKRGKVTITATAKRGKKKAKIRFKVSN